METIVLNASSNLVSRIRCAKDFCCPLRSDDYKYMWSLLHGRSTNILNLDYPNNFIDAIKTLYYKNQYKFIFADLSEDILDQLESDGLIIKTLTEVRIEFE